MFTRIGPPGQPEPVAIGPDGRVYVGTNQLGHGDADAPSKVFAYSPAGELVAPALHNLAPGGTLALAGIHMTRIPALDYAEIFRERAITSVTANTRADGEECLLLAGRQGLAVTTMPYDLADADRALADLAAGKVRGAAVLVP